MLLVHLFHLIEIDPVHANAWSALISPVITVHFESAGFFLSCFQVLWIWPSTIRSTFWNVPGWRSWWSDLSGAPWSTQGSSCLPPTCSWTGAWLGCSLAGSTAFCNHQFLPEALLFSTAWGVQELYQIYLLYRWVNLGHVVYSRSQKAKDNFLLNISSGELYYF